MYDIKINVGTIGADNKRAYPLSGFAAAFATLALKMATSGVVADIALQTMIRELHTQLLKSDDTEVGRIGVEFYRLIE